MATKRKIEGDVKAYESFLAKVEVMHPIDGHLEIDLPRVDMKCIMRVSTSVATLAKAVQKFLPEGVLNQATDPDNPDAGMKSSDLVSLIPQILPNLLTEIVTVLSQYLEEDEAWIASLEPEDIMNLFSPFLTRILEIGISAFSRFGAQKTSDVPLPMTEQSKSLEVSPIQGSKILEES